MLSKLREKLRGKEKNAQENTREIKNRSLPQLVLLSGVLSLALLCCMASSISSDSWEDCYRITWLVLSASSLALIYMINMRRSIVRLSHALLIESAILLEMLLLMGVFMLRSLFPTEFSIGQTLLVLPYMLAPTIVGVMLGRGLGVYVAFCCSLFGLALLPESCPCAIQFNYLAISLPTGIACAFISGRAHKREQVLLAGCLAGAVAYASAFALLGMRGNGLSPADGLSFSAAGFHFVSCATEFAAALGVNFVLAAFIGGLMPALELVFNISTPITWLEWADMNHPILRKLQIAAPGTFHHSLVVQRLAEAAAEQVGADVTRAGVCALYHDIGKTANPLYFAENMGDVADSPHNKLTPEASVRIIIGHVSEGVELARTHHLNKRIIDVIREHHGVSTAYFFYRKAMDQYEEELKKFEDGLSDTEPAMPDKATFSYAGPIPQTKESGIVSMADAVESATRSLQRPTEDDIRSMIDSIFKGRILDGHLQDCTLTLGEIAKMKESFFSTIKTMHHNRIAYPKRKDEDAGVVLAEKRREEEAKLGKEAGNAAQESKENKEER